MTKFRQGEFVPKNPQKYVGKRPITYRSSWEFSLMRCLDDHPAVLKWASESITIPYENPFTKRWTMYVPDFLVVYVDKNGREHAELIEVKPAKEVPTFDGKVTRHTKLTQMLNAAKWQAAVKFCAKNNMYFRVATERDLFGRGK